MGNDTLKFEIDTKVLDTLSPAECEKEMYRSLKVASDSIQATFAWDRTREGDAFWEYVTSRLDEISGLVELIEEEKTIKVTIDGVEYIARPIQLT